MDERMKTPEQQATEFVRDTWLTVEGELREVDKGKIIRGAEITFLEGWRARSAIDTTHLHKWIPLSKQLPPKYEWCLFHYPWGPEVNQYEGEIPGGGRMFHRGYYDVSNTSENGPTHWMPLPIEPEGFLDD